MKKAMFLLQCGLQKQPVQLGQFESCFVMIFRQITNKRTASSLSESDGDSDGVGAWHILLDLVFFLGGGDKSI